MRRFFSFKSSTSNNGNKSPPAPDPPDNEKVYWERPRETETKVPLGRKVLGLRDSETEDSCSSLHRRSASFSSPAVYTDFGEGNRSRSPSVCGNPPQVVAESSLCCHSRTPERHMRTRRGDAGRVRQLHAAENPNSPSSSSIHHCSSGNSAHSSPVSLRCRATRLQQVTDSNRTLDLYIDGEHQQSNETKDSQNHFYDSGDNYLLGENKVVSCMGRPPRALSTAPSSPTYSKENFQAYSFGEAKGIRRHLFIPDDARPTSGVYHTKTKFEQLLRPFRGKPSRDYDSETTTTVEDIYEDSSNPGPASNSTGASEENCTDFSITENIYHCRDVEQLLYGRQSWPENGSTGFKMDKLSVSQLQKQSTDEELIKKMKEVDNMLTILSDEDHELENLQINNLNVSTLLQNITSITEDRRYLALELSSQIKRQIAERSSTRERLKQAKFELDTRTMRLEKEKNELQSSLEKELDRRSSDWSLKLRKFQSEEQRLRERVRELAEQNVSLQREISTLKGNEASTKSRIMNSEMQLNDLAASLDVERTENHNLRQALTELQERLNGTEEERNYIRQNLKDKEKEGKELHRVVIRFQRMCREQDKTIDGLRQGYSNEIGKQSIERDDKVSMLQMEQIRLASVEQMLRKELESSRDELKSVRHENMCLLDRLQGTKTGLRLSSIKLDQELRDRVDCLQSQSLSLLNDHSQLLEKIFNLVQCRQHEGFHEDKRDSDGYSVGDYTSKYQSLRRRIENFSGSLLTVPEILDKKSTFEDFESHSETTQDNRPRQSMVPDSEDGLEVELKAETLLTRVLREKLCSKEIELEQLQSDLASSIRAHEVLQTEVQRLRDELSCLTHKTKDMELQILKKDESIDQLQHDLQKCRKELTSTCGILMNVSVERDRIWEEVKHSKETIMLLNLEVSSLKKKVEVLDEHVLIKEGEITILKDSLVNKPFDAIYSPKSVKEFSLE
ncbi:cingulin-like protein 1 isoform X1 [Iris pallida]|uniref:Cingulin-like protein 1 isoform X1 n=1 Tax=Iris pallida TaxID=29817 RepID=A0AAX6GTH4_IRIPA|nr:cingulin-like protein 1 isoform X1 [Iris pallida]